MLTNFAEPQQSNRILIIEDEPDISDFLCEALSLSDYEVAQAYDGVEGLEKIETFKPDMVLLDIMMPRMNGLEVCRRIRANENTRNIRVIFISAKGSLEEKLEGFQAGASDFIVKPFSSSELLARIEAHLRIDSLSRDLEFSETRYRQLIEHSPDGILLFSDENKLLFANARFKSMINIKSEHLEAGSTLKQLGSISPLFKEVSSLIRKVEETRLIVTRTIVTNFQRHQPSVLEIRGIPTDLLNSKAAMVQIVLRDVTERHNMEKLLARTEKINSLGILTAGIAHEINNPLTGISNAIQMLQKAPINQQKRQEMLDLVLANIGRITRIIEDLRVFSRQERLESDRFDLIPAIEETLKLLRYQSEDKHVEMQLQHDGRKYFVEGSKSQFQQLMINLLLNAVQSIDGKDGVTRVELTQAQLPLASAQIKIIDNGCGIPEEQLDQIFDPFFTTKRDWHGTGLGLAVSHRIIQLLKGTISVTSKETQGTTFTLTLPLIPEA